MIHFAKLRKIFFRLLQPRSADPDKERREFILNILLLSSIGLMIAANLINLYYFLFTPYQPENALSSGSLLLILGIFAALYAAVRRGYFEFAVQAFIGFYFLLTTLLAYLWGVELPVVPLFYGLIIIIAFNGFKLTISSISAFVTATQPLVQSTNL